METRLIIGVASLFDSAFGTSGTQGTVRNLDTALYTGISSGFTKRFVFDRVAYIQVNGTV
jgi:hypothetical protein